MAFALDMEYREIQQDLRQHHGNVSIDYFLSSRLAPWMGLSRLGRSLITNESMKAEERTGFDRNLSFARSVKRMPDRSSFQVL